MGIIECIIVEYVKIYTKSSNFGGGGGGRKKK
jgi:hypothetical protein